MAFIDGHLFVGVQEQEACPINMLLYNVSLTICVIYISTS